MAGVVDFEAHLTGEVANRLCGAKEAGCCSVSASAGSNRREAFEHVRNDPLSLEVGGHRERVVGIAFSLVWIVLRDRHARTRRQRDH